MFFLNVDGFAVAYGFDVVDVYDAVDGCYIADGFDIINSVTLVECLSFVLLSRIFLSLKPTNVLLLSIIVMLLWMIAVVSELAKHIILSSVHKNFAHSQMQSFSNS
jgi:hypothetical protein